VQTQHDDFDDVQGQGAIPIIHDQDLAVTEARLSLDVGLTRRFGASLMLPVRLISTRIAYRDGRGREVQLVQPSTHHRNEVLSGLGDPMLLGVVTEAWGGLRLTGRLGFSIPLGRTEDDPFAMPDVFHQHIQMGTGTVNPIVALEAAYTWERWRLAGFGFTQQAVYENSKGFQAGDRYAVGVALRRMLGGFSVRGGAELLAETFERWSGIRYTDEGNQGRIDALVTAGATWQASRTVSIDATLKIALVNHAVGGQLSMPAILEVGAAWSLGGPPAAARRAGAHDDDDDDHDHAHGDAHENGDGHAPADGEHGDHAHGDGEAHDHGALDTTGADVLDLGKNGSRVELVPVPGKITIFDFWATWCVPCKTLEPVLVELAKKHPERVALRRIDAVDWDSPVVAQHLTPRAFDLPHLKIYDAKGVLVLEESSGPGKLGTLIESVRAIVEPPAPATAPPAPATPAPAPPATSAPAPARPKVVAPARREIVVTEAGFEPAVTRVPRGTPVTLRFLRKTKKTCATEIMFEHDGNRVMRALPLDTPVELTLTFAKAGRITYACAMDMIRGTLDVR
jgi:thiol-disulfide isomerase/thioredoxin/plastocyanin